MEIPVLTDWLDTQVPMGTNLLFTCKENPSSFTVAAEICEDVVGHRARQVSAMRWPAPRLL
ncbi:MAG: hypothetical protein ACLUD2_18760 [Clostridium sp.]